MKITARTLSGQTCELHLEHGRIGETRPLREDSPDLPWIAPGLIDLQINGFAGIDFNRPFESKEAWHHATQELYAQGCTGFLATLITQTADAYAQLLPAWRNWLDRDRRNCLGLHLEGPWLNPDPGYRGAHPAEAMRPPSTADFIAWKSELGPWLKLITLAPEIDLPTSLELIRTGTAEGVAFFLGHSEAQGEVLAQALAAGAIGWTHLGNAVPSPLPKFENVIWHALAQPKLFASLIPDGIHLPPHAFCVLAQALNSATPSRLLLTTDAMAAAGSTGCGPFTLGTVTVELGSEGAARLPGSGRLAGSTLTPLAGVIRAERFSGLPREQVWDAFSSRPASLINLQHGLDVGRFADFCLLAPGSEPRLLATYHRGEKVFTAP